MSELSKVKSFGVLKLLVGKKYTFPQPIPSEFKNLSSTNCFNILDIS